MQMAHRGTRWAVFLMLSALLLGGGAWVDSTRAQDSPTPAAPDTDNGDGQVEPESIAAPVRVEQRKGINLARLIISGGVLMIPIAVMSLLALTFVIERFLALRRSRVLPHELVGRLGHLGAQGSFDPREAYRICQQYPSAASKVIRAMLLKVGRPHAEVERAVSEASQREADRLFSNIRWLNLAATVTPLLGLLGTVWGMIRAFYDTSELAPGQNKAEELAKGIYVALVTTLAGLSVAIPSAVFAHYFEGRVQSLFHEVDEMLFSLMPQIERYEGRVRFSRQEDGTPQAEPAPAQANTG